MTVTSNVKSEAISDRESLENTLADYLGGCALNDLLEYLDGDLDNPFEQEILEDICEAKAKIKVSVEISYED